MVDAQHIQKVYKTYGIQVNALKDITLTIEKGQVVPIVGPSDAGKPRCSTVSLVSTILRVVRSRLKERNLTVCRTKNARIAELSEYDLSSSHSISFPY